MTNRKDILKFRGNSGKIFLDKVFRISYFEHVLNKYEQMCNNDQ